MLFGHQNDGSSQPVATTAPVTDGVNPLAVDPATGASLPTAPVSPQPLDLDEPSVLNQPTPLSSDDIAAATSTASPSMPFPPAPDTTEPAPVTTEPTAVDTPAPSPMPDPTPADTSTPFTSDDSATASVDADALIALKTQALAQLSPLVDQLDQTPEEKFRTTMMLIQSTDNPSRIQDAYDAAQAITDEKIRAQALLDVINEINYFTQKPGS